MVEYDQGSFGSVERAKARIHQIIKNGLDQKIGDSPVHSVLDLNIEPEGKPLGRTELHEYSLKGTDDAVIGLVTGDIQNVKHGVDVWVNPENIHMQMARPFENSISGVIRYHGSDRENGRVKDTIALELARQMDGRSAVDPGEVLVTGSGALERTHNVKRIFHVAANVGQAGKGVYAGSPKWRDAWSNALNAVRDQGLDGSRARVAVDHDPADAGTPVALGGPSKRALSQAAPRCGDQSPGSGAAVSQLPKKRFTS